MTTSRDICGDSVKVKRLTNVVGDSDEIAERLKKILAREPGQLRLGCERVVDLAAVRRERQAIRLQLSRDLFLGLREREGVTDRVVQQRRSAGDGDEPAGRERERPAEARDDPGPGERTTRQLAEIVLCRP